MVEKNGILQEKQSLTERLWLAYFNNYLYEKGIILESNRNKIITKINCCKGYTYEKVQIVLIVLWAACSKVDIFILKNQNKKHPTKMFLSLYVTLCLFGTYIF